MALNNVNFPYAYAPNFDSGRPVYNGYLYFGEPDLDPEIIANQKTIYFVQEDGNQVVGIQPVRTGTGGVPTYNGSPVAIKIDGDYSVKVLNSSMSQVYYSPNGNVSEVIQNALQTVATLAEAKTNMYPVGTVITIGDRGNSRWVVVTAGSEGAPDEYSLASGSGVDLKLNESGPVDVTWLGAALDGSTLNTAVVQAATLLNNKVYVPYNCKYDQRAVITSMPDDVVIQDESMINGYNSAGETSKEVGIISKDSAENDTHQIIASDHHAILQLQNYGEAGTVSASERKASVIWTAGKFENAADGKRGYRGAAIRQFTKESTASHWVETLRSLAPWNAISGNYEDWETGESIAGVGIYRRYDNNHYVSASGGTTGATPPTHTTGTVSDGAVDWTWVDSTDRTIYAWDEYGRLVIGGGALGDTFRHKVSQTDPGGGGYSSVRAARGINKNVVDKLLPTNDTGDEVTAPYLQTEYDAANVLTVLKIMRHDGTASIMEFTTTGGALFSENRRNWTQAGDGDTTPSVTGVATLYTQNTGATSITALDDASDGQVVDIVIADVNTTLVSSATFLLTGGVNVTTPAVYSTVTMQKVPSTLSDRWIEIGRSIK